MPDLDPRLHIVAVTAIIEKDGKFLIAKRAASEKVFPNKWTVPGGKVETTDYQHLSRTSTTLPQWYNVAEFVLRKEVREEVGLEIEKPIYVTDLVFIRPDGIPVMTISYAAKYKSGEVVLNDEMSEYAWVTPEEAKNYDMIDGIQEEIEAAARLLEK